MQKKMEKVGKKFVASIPRRKEREKGEAMSKSRRRTSCRRGWSSTTSSSSWRSGYVIGVIGCINSVNVVFEVLLYAGSSKSRRWFVSSHAPSLFG